ncbi:MAG: hypothetical protein LBH06_00360 [Rikenellaceae bacterium]|nr:hypothetical protein [Rikenellaceae bacterium]
MNKIIKSGLRRETYCPPAVEILEVSVEAGFSATTSGTFNNGDPANGLNWEEDVW